MRTKLLTALLCCLATAGTEESFTARLHRLGVNTALVLPSQAIDEYPIWSPDSNWIGAMVDGHWVKLELNKVELVAAKWHGLSIAAAKSTSLMSLSQEEVKQWQPRSKHDAREVKLPGGGSIRLRQHGLSTALELTDSKGRTRTLWASDLENCGEISVSPSGRFVAYICELNGMVVSDVQALIDGPAK